MCIYWKYCCFSVFESLLSSNGKSSGWNSDNSGCISDRFWDILSNRSFFSYIASYTSGLAVVGSNNIDESWGVCRDTLPVIAYVCLFDNFPGADSCRPGSCFVFCIVLLVEGSVVRFDVRTRSRGGEFRSIESRSMR